MRNFIASKMRVFLIAFFWMICTTPHAQKLDLLTENFPPYNFVDQDRIVGINADILYEACSIAEVECTFRTLPWKRGVNYTQLNPNSGIFSTSRTTQREGSFTWVGPLVSSYACFYRLKSSNYIDVATEDSLKKYTVGVSNGDVYEGVLSAMGFRKGEHFITYAKKNDELKMFKRGKLDLIIGSSLTLSSKLYLLDLKPEDVVPVFEISDSSLVGNYLALNKKSNPIIATKLQKAIDVMKQDGRFNSFVARYYGVLKSPDETIPDHLKRCVVGMASY